MTYKDVSDPLASSIDLNNFLSSLATKQDPYSPIAIGPGPRASSMTYGAPVAYAAPMMQQARGLDMAGYDGTGSSEDDSSASGDSDDVHFHIFKSVHLRSHTRVSLPIFRGDAHYKDVYRCKGITNRGHRARRMEASSPADDDILDVWHALQVTNSTDKPWTTAPIMITNNGNFQCGSQIFYTPVKSEALVEMTKALSVQAKREVTQVETQELKEVMGRKCRVIMQSTVFTIQNGKAVDVHLVLEFTIAGEIVSAEPAPKKKVPKPVYLGEFNPEYALQVEVLVPARQSKLVTIQSKLYAQLPEVRSERGSMSMLPTLQGQF